MAPCAISRHQAPCAVHNSYHPVPSAILHRPEPSTISHRSAPCAVPPASAPCTVPQTPSALRGPSISGSAPCAVPHLPGRRSPPAALRAVARRRLRCAPTIAACIARCHSLRAVAGHLCYALWLVVTCSGPHSAPGTLEYSISPLAPCAVPH
eukprot:6207383-Pleurochrysis_carterae.AAC.2